MDCVQARVLFVNGITYAPSEAMDVCRTLSEKNEHIDVELVYNACDQEGVFRGHNLTSAKQTIAQLSKKVHEYVSKKIHVCIIAHSMGCDIVESALGNGYTSKELLQKYVSIYGFGGPSKISKELGKEVVNYLARNKECDSYDAGAYGGGLINLVVRRDREGWGAPNNDNRYHIVFLNSNLTNSLELHDFNKSYSSKAISELQSFRKNKQIPLWNQAHDNRQGPTKPNCCIKVVSYAADTVGDSALIVGFWSFMVCIVCPPLAPIAAQVVGYSVTTGILVKTPANVALYLQGEQ